MIRGSRGCVALDLFSNFKQVRNEEYFIDFSKGMTRPSGLFLVSRTGDEG